MRLERFCHDFQRKQESHLRIAKFFSSLAYDRNLNVIHLSLKNNIQVIVLFHANGFLQIIEVLQGICSDMSVLMQRVGGRLQVPRVF